MLRTELPHASRVVRPGVGQPPHRRLDVVQLHEMELDVLPRRDVAEAARVPLRHVGERVELLGGRACPAGSSRAASGVVGLPLAVGAAHEAERAPVVGRDLAALEPLERRDELVDVALSSANDEPRAAERLAMVMRQPCVMSSSRAAAAARGRPSMRCASRERTTSPIDDGSRATRGPARCPRRISAVERASST